MDRRIIDRLRPWQVAPAQHLYDILQRLVSAYDTSDTGVGKTYVATAVAVALGLPTLVVAPKISLTAWARVAAEFNDSFSVIGYEKLRTGNTEFGQWQHQDKVNEGRKTFYKCQCCQLTVSLENPQPCFAHHLGIHCLETKKHDVNYGMFKFNPAVKAVIFDEVHRCGGMNSTNAEFLIAARRQSIRHLGLSATLACDPMKMRALGYSLDLHGDRHNIPFKQGYLPMLPNFYQWAAQHGCRRIPPMPGIRWAVSEDRQAQIMASIREQIIPSRGVRLTTAEIPGFPERDITAELYDIENPSTVDLLYAEMAVALGVLADKSNLDKAPDHPLTKIIRARQRIELLKVPLAVELATDAIEKGLSVGIFVNFSQTIDELARRLNCHEIIDGRPEYAKPRQHVIDSFQRDESRLVLVNSEAGGITVSLHDVRGQFPRVGFVFPGFSATTFVQLCGRFQRDGGRSRSHYRVILAANTIEEQIKRKLDRKLVNLAALNDGDMVPDNLPLTRMPFNRTII